MFQRSLRLVLNIFVVFIGKCIHLIGVEFDCALNVPNVSTLSFSGTPPSFSSHQSIPNSTLSRSFTIQSFIFTLRGQKGLDHQSSTERGLNQFSHFLIRMLSHGAIITTNYIIDSTELRVQASYLCE